MRRHLIIGGSGQLGTAFGRILPNAIAPSRSELDVTNPGQVRSLFNAINPSGIINCSGYTDVDGAEEDEAAAFAINTTGVGAVAAIADEAKIPFVTFSTDYVFDGRARDAYVESSATNPLNIYGRSKVAGEQLALRYPRSLVIRTSWMLSTTHQSFVTAILDRAAAGPLRVVYDQVGCPTFAEDVAATTIDVIDGGLSGLLHLVSGPRTSWHGLAEAALSVAGLDPSLALACTTDDYPRVAERPRWSVLDSERLEEAGIATLPSWRRRLPDLVAAGPPG